MILSKNQESISLSQLKLTTPTKIKNLLSQQAKEKKLTLNRFLHPFLVAIAKQEIKATVDFSEPVVLIKIKHKEPSKHYHYKKQVESPDEESILPISEDKRMIHLYVDRIVWARIEGLMGDSGNISAFMAPIFAAVADGAIQEVVIDERV